MVNLGRSLACIVLLATSAAAPRPQSADARAYLDKAIAMVRDNALYADRVDWPKVSAAVHAEGDQAANLVETYPALITLVRALGDHHSFLQLPDERRDAYRAVTGHALAYPADPDPPRTLDKTFFGRRAPDPFDRTMRGMRIRTLVVPATTSNSPDALAAYVHSLRASITAAPSPCGYVLDLRGNSGGNMMAMISGLSALLGDGSPGGYVSRSGLERWHLRGGVFLVRQPNGAEQVALNVAGSARLPNGDKLPVALLLDGGTASSGEITAVAFQGRARTRSFGQHSYGVSTSTSGFALPDGANLVLVDAQVQDRNGRRYPDGIAPDEVLQGDPSARARSWVASACRNS